MINLIAFLIGLIVGLIILLILIVSIYNKNIKTDEKDIKQLGELQEELCKMK